jgi:hypothetical protein
MREEKGDGGGKSSRLGPPALRGMAHSLLRARVPVQSMKLLPNIRWRLHASWLALILAIFAIGCGDGDGDGATAAASVSKAEYVKQADDICAKTEGRQQKRVGMFGKKERQQTPNAEAELVRFAGVPPLAMEAEELAELPLPTSEAAQAKAFLKAFEVGVEAAEEDPTSLLAADSNPFAKAEAIAVKFGFKVCRGA